MEFTKDEIKQGINEAYKDAKGNAFFGEGFKAGIAFVLAKTEREKIGRLEGVSSITDSTDDSDITRCPKCGSSDHTMVRTQPYKCNDCGTKFL